MSYLLSRFFKYTKKVLSRWSVYNYLRMILVDKSEENMKITISAESAIDLPKDFLEKYQIKTIPFTVLLGEKMFLDGEMEITEMFDYVDKTKVLPKTSAVNEYQFTEHFAKLKKDADAVIHFSMASSMSSAYSNAVSASKKFEHIYVVDTKSLSAGIALLAIKASKMANNGKGVEQILEEINKDIPKIQVSLVLNKLDYLRKGGRCSGLVCFGANLLQIHPQLILKNGKLSPSKKYRGNFDKCVESYVNDTLEQFDKYDKDIVFLMYTTLSEKAKEKAKELLKNAGFKQIVEAKTGATISSHVGPNAIGVLYLTK